MWILLLIILSLLVVVCLLAVWRLNKYIAKLEGFIDEELIKRMDIYEDTLRTAIKEEYIKPDMTIKKPLYPNETT